MLLNLKKSISIAVSFLCLTAHAQGLPTIEAGRYELLSGEPKFCTDFSISEKQAQSKHLLIGGFYSFNMTNSVHSVESDIDSTCEFKEQNRREIQEDKTVLTRINEEYCKGKLRSRTISIASFNHNGVSIRHEVDRGSLTCVWKLR